MDVSVLETDRLRLRRYTWQDHPALVGVFADYETRSRYPDMADPENARAWIEWSLRNYEEYGFGLWALEIKDSGAFIGDCGLTYQEVEGGQELEVGYHVVRSERRKGYATEAARACLEYGFAATSADMICSIVAQINEASQRVAGRIHTHQRTFIKNGESTFLFYTPREMRSAD